MAQLFQNQLQPFEENQSPSPTHEHPDPFALHLSRSRSSRLSNPGDSPTSPINTLHRQLSGDPDAPPPAWKRRASFTQKPQSPVQEGESQGSSARSPSQSRAARTSPTETVPRLNIPPPSSARRHPQLQMTTTTRPPIPSGMFTHESPNASSTSLYDPTFAPPQPAFLRKRGEGGSRSNRSSIHSMDTSGMTSEDLWNLESNEAIADLSNPQRNAMERPLDTVRRLSMRSERGTPAVSPYSPHGLPVDFMWPVAPPEEETPMPMRRMKSKSTTNVPALGQSRLGRKKTSRQASADPQMIGKMIDAPDMPRSNSVFISSAHSSATDLSKSIPGNKSLTSLGSRPPSAYYSRDFLSQLAPREGGYAIAAMLSSPTAQQASAEERRRSNNLEASRASRPPTSKSAGMGRWSLDGGEHYNRPYGSTSSANTTTSNLSAPPINSPDPSPPADEPSIAAMLPEGASPAVNVRTEGIPLPAVANPLSATPNIPSPLSRSVTDDTPLTSVPPINSAAIPIPPVPSASTASPAGQTLSSKKSKKQLAKEAKAAEKAEAAKVLAARAAKAKEEVAKRQAEKEREKEAKEAAKKKEKEEKERKKLEKKMNKSTGSKLKSPSQPTLGTPKVNDVPPVPPVAPLPIPAPSSTTESSSASIGTSATAVSSASNPGSARNVLEKKQPSSSLPVPTGERRNVSMPAGTSSLAANGTKSEPAKKVKLGLFGTIRKRFSTVDTSSQASLAAKPAARTPIMLDEPATTPAAVSTSASAPATPVARVEHPNGEAVAIASVAGTSQTASDSSGSTDTARSPTPRAASTMNGDGSISNINEKSRVTGATGESSQPDIPIQSTSVRQHSPSPGRGPASSDSHTSPSSGSRQRNSIQGPRPMPRSGSIGSRNHPSPQQHQQQSQMSAPHLETASGSGDSSGLSQVQSHLTSTSSSGTYDSQTPMTSEEGHPVVDGVKGSDGSEETVKRGLPDLGRVVAAH